MIRRITAFSAAILVALGVTVGVAAPAFAVVTYHYAGGEQIGIVADGAQANITIESPQVDTTHDGVAAHSVAELAIKSADKKDIVEVGWRKPTGTATELFVFHWVNGVSMGYNNCVDYAPEPFNAGALFPSTVVGTGTGMRFYIQHSGTAWWIAYDSKWVCHIPDSVWTAAGRTFTKVNEVQAFGEVASATTATPCSDMGDGQAATSGTAARIGSYGLINQTSGSAAAFTTYTIPATAGISVAPASSTTFRYGWSGYKANNTLPGNTGSC